MPLPDRGLPERNIAAIGCRIAKGDDDPRVRAELQQRLVVV